jgi:hypothetical protein
MAHAGVCVQLRLVDASAAAPAVHGVSALETLGAPLARAGAGALFDTADVWLSERGAGAERAVLLGLQQPSDDASDVDSAAPRGKLTPLGRQHELWREIPRLRSGAPDPAKHVKARPARNAAHAPWIHPGHGFSPCWRICRSLRW